MNNFSGAQGLGNIRFNTVHQGLEVYDGQMWQPIQMDTVYLSLTQDAVDAISWVNQKRVEELELAALASTNPTIKDLVDTIKQKQEQIQIVRTLIKQEHGESAVSIPYGPA
jgi:hypothetical protein